MTIRNLAQAAAVDAKRWLGGALLLVLYLLRSYRRPLALLALAALVTFLLIAGTRHAWADSGAGEGVPTASLRYRGDLTRQARLMWGLDAPVAAFAGQVHQESYWRPDAVSRVGAQGMAQFMPKTATWWCDLHGLAPTDCQPRNPTWALRAMVGYDRWLWDRLQAADACQRFAMALASYNGGLGWIRRDQKLASSQGLDPGQYFGSVDTVNAGRAEWAIRENRDYPRRILLQHAPRYQSAGWGRSACP